jgi:hypothetical protein
MAILLISQIQSLRNPKKVKNGKFQPVLLMSVCMCKKYYALVMKR